MASILSAGTTSGTALNMSGDTSGVLQLATNGTTTALTLDASQNATFAGTLTTTGITNSGVATGARFNPTGSSVTGNGMYLPAANSLGLSTNGTNAVYIDSSQNVQVGTTTRSNDEKFTINQSATAMGISVRSLSTALGNYESSDSGHNAYWTFGRDNASTGNFVFASGGTLRGSISSSTGTYTASSDLRLKKNITNISYGLNEVMAMRPVTYLMNEEADTAKKHLGFIAQELKELVDESVDDLIDPDTQFYMLDKGGLVPVLVKAIQELKAINDTQAETINALTARIVALETA